MLKIVKSSNSATGLRMMMALMKPYTKVTDNETHSLLSPETLNWKSVGLLFALPRKYRLCISGSSYERLLSGLWFLVLRHS